MPTETTHPPNNCFDLFMLHALW